MRLDNRAFLVFIFLTGIAAADYSQYHIIAFSMEQSIEGDGYFRNYNAIRMPNVLGISGEANNGVESKDYSHGSGRIKSESLLTAESSNKTEGTADEAELMDFKEALSCIQYDEDAKLAYHPAIMNMGTGYYALHPITLSSLLKEETWLKNRGGASSMQNQVEYAHALDKQLKLLVRDYLDEEDPGTTMMNISQSITNGKAHIGVLQGDPNAMEGSAILPDTEEIESIAFARSVWRKPLVYVDEDDFGTMKIEKKMNLTSFVNKVTEDDDWLPCCSAGYEDMNKLDQKGHSAGGVFDCSCFKLRDKAQFSR